MYRGVARGEGIAPPNLADQLTLFEPGWADFAPHTTASRVANVVADHDSLLTQ